MPGSLCRGQIKRGFLPAPLRFGPTVLSSFEKSISFPETIHADRRKKIIMFAGTFPVISAEEAASLIPDGAMVALSGFANAGTAKQVPRAIASKAR